MSGSSNDRGEISGSDNGSIHFQSDDAEGDDGDGRDYRDTTDEWKLKFQGILFKDEYIVSTFLNPIAFCTIKKILTEGEFLHWKVTFTLNCKDFWGTRCPEALSERQPMSKVRRLNAAGFAERMRIDQDFFLTRRTSRPDQISIEQEIDLLLERMEDGAKSPLKFWKSNQFDFPWLRPIAKHYLAIPCSSAEAERTFSVSGRPDQQIQGQS